MVYCQECGSEISNVDSFCPFCGISLQSLNLKDTENKDKGDKTEGVIELKEQELNEVELTSDDLKDEDIDMSETVVVNNSALVDDTETNVDSGYLDIKTLKSEDESDEDQDAPINSDSETETNVETSSSNESGSLDLDVSDNQDDIQDLLEDDIDFVDKSKDVSIDSTGESIVNDDEMQPELDSVSNENEAIDETLKTESNEDIDTSEKITDYSDDEFIDSNSLTTESEEKVEESEIEKIEADIENSAEPKVSNTPLEIQTAEDSEIDEAISVIDSKALAWKENADSSIGTNFEEVSNDLESKEFSELENTKDETILTEANENLEITENNLDENDTDDEVLETESKDTVSEYAEAPKPEILEEHTSKDEESNSNIVIDSNLNNEDTEGVEPSSLDETEIDGNGNIEESQEGLVQDPEIPSQTTPNIGVSDTDGRKSAKLKPLDEGILLNNRYEIVRKIGGGGMGAVYLANDNNLGGVLRAVKEMVQSYIEEEQQEKAIQDFKRESMILTTLDHPSIPTIYDYFFDEREARFYLVMKYISGGDLSARLRAAPEGKLDEVSVTDWALQIADVLDYLHSMDPPIVYRDLKPANIMVDGNSDRVMLIDFGIARSINKEEKGVTAVGTMGYAPPELFSGNVEPGSDIYSLGSTMFHLLTGADPQNNPLLIFDFQKHPRPRQINPQLSDQMERILMRSVEYNAERRFSSAAEMRNSLKEHLENLKKGSVSFGIKETPTAVALSDQPVFCGFCGQKIVATDMFCAFCGAKQPLAQPGVQSQEYHISETTAKLMIEGTSELDYKPFELVKNENLLGRRDPMSNIFPEIDLSKYDPQTKISRKHARILRDGDNFLLEDLGSSNGTTFISGMNERIKLLPQQKQVIKNGDKIQVGDTTLQFMVD